MAHESVSLAVIGAVSDRGPCGEVRCRSNASCPNGERDIAGDERTVVGPFVGSDSCLIRATCPRHGVERQSPLNRAGSSPPSVRSFPPTKAGRLLRCQVPSLMAFSLPQTVSPGNSGTLVHGITRAQSGSEGTKRGYGP